MDGLLGILDSLRIRNEASDVETMDNMSQELQDLLEKYQKKAPLNQIARRSELVKRGQAYGPLPIRPDKVKIDSYLIIQTRALEKSYRKKTSSTKTRGCRT